MTYTFLLLSLQVLLGRSGGERGEGKSVARVKALLGKVAKIIKKSNAKISVFKFKI